MEATERTFTSWDGAELFYRAWIPNKATDKALLLFHRGHEHSGRWQETVDSLDLDDIAIFAWDARGHGRSAGERGAAKSLYDVIKDVDVFARHVSEKFGIPIENMIVLAHSLAAITVTAWVHDYAPPIRAMILATAAFHVKLYVPFAIPVLRLFRPRFVKSYVKAKMLTHDREQAARYKSDPLIFRQIAVNVLLDLHERRVGERRLRLGGNIAGDAVGVGGLDDEDLLAAGGEEVDVRRGDFERGQSRSLSRRGRPVRIGLWRRLSVGRARCRGRAAHLRARLGAVTWSMNRGAAPPPQWIDRNRRR